MRTFHAILLMPCWVSAVSAGAPLHHHSVGLAVTLRQSVACGEVQAAHMLLQAPMCARLPAWGGNLALTRERALPSNLVSMLIALGATVTVTSVRSKK